jgi:hypothetical protein
VKGERQKSHAKTQRRKEKIGSENLPKIERLFATALQKTSQKIDAKLRFMFCETVTAQRVISWRLGVFA